MENVIQFKNNKNELTPIGKKYNGVTLYCDENGVIGTQIDFINWERT